MDKSVIIPFEINSLISKSYAYYCLIITALKQYVTLVSKKEWPKYETLKIYFDKEARYLRGKKSASPNMISETEYYMKLVGGVKFKKAKNDDPYYLACVGSAYQFINKLLGEPENGPTGESK